ncbi:MAG: peptide-methionine (R)-S-oxide reductase MsrB [Methanobacteriota archaeon]|nr:MAG: peptide-methionine (R)-S-oxide reductase MsrB [Euryarchaeota archaeon]
MEESEGSEDKWKNRLDSERYKVLRLAHTERPFSGELLYNKRKGVYVCAGCGSALFRSESKYESGCGWPSFMAPVSEDAVREREDKSHGMIRKEILCAKCGGHLGHVFDDGPIPTRLRYCINSLSLNFREKD